MEISNKQKAVALLNSLETGATEPLSFINPNKYIQHNLGAADGLAGLKAFISILPKGETKVKVIRTFEDGNFVFTHTEYNVFGPKIGFDVFRFEDGKIVEHWDNLQETAKPNPSGHTMIDGPTASKDLDKTEANKTLVKNFLEEVFVKGTGKIEDYIDGDNYTQHNPFIADKLSGLMAALGEWAKQGVTMKYEIVHQVLGEGNFVLAMVEGQLGGKHSSFYDMFRIENGKIVEHWDVVEEIPAKENWKNTNGKF